MLSDEILCAALANQKGMYTCLTEIEELTTELAEAVSRQDSVSVRLFLSMRQEEIDKLLAHRAALRRQCVELPTAQGAILRHLLTGKPTGSEPLSDRARQLQQQVSNTRALLQRVCRADEAVNRRFAGPKSFYAQH